MNNQDEFITIKDAAENLKVAPVTIWRFIKSGALPGIKIGRVWRIKGYHFRKFIRERNAQQ